jgi:hypothetical protein
MDRCLERMTKDDRETREKSGDKTYVWKKWGNEGRDERDSQPGYKRCHLKP